MVNTRCELVPLNASRGRLLPHSGDGKMLNPSTLWRWIRKGLLGANGERIRLEVVYVGRTPHVSPEMVQAFFAKVTAAKLEHIRQQELADSEVTAEELAAAGLINKREATSKPLQEKIRRSYVGK